MKNFKIHSVFGLPFSYVFRVVISGCFESSELSVASMRFINDSVFFLLLLFLSAYISFLLVRRVEVPKNTNVSYVRKSKRVQAQRRYR